MATGIHKFLEDLFREQNLHRTHDRVRYVQFVLSSDEDDGNLADLLSGKKRALFRLKDWFASQNVKPPEAGHIVVLTDFFGEPLAVVKISKIQIVAYKDFNEEMARASGVDGGDVDTWRNTKHAAIEADCKSLDITFDENVELLAMWIERLYPL